MKQIIYVVLAVIFSLAVVVGVSYAGKVHVERVESEKNQEILVGGERDEHGCLGTAGYRWCESKQKCMRFWEEECPSF